MNLRIYIAGEDSIGRKALIQTYMTGECDREEYSTCLFFIQHKNVIIDKKNIQLIIQLDESANNNATNRRLSYCLADVIIFCFCLVNKYSYQQIETQYRKEILKYSENKPYILVGLKKDKRDNFNSIEKSYFENVKIKTRKGERLKEKINAQNYIECSSWEHENINEVFETAINLVLNGSQNTNKDAHATQATKKNRNILCNIF